nr:VanZ family protein [Shouchella xiaoxiensis]
MFSILVCVVGFIAFSSSTPYANQDIRSYLSHLPLSWLEQTRLANYSFFYGNQQIGLAYMSVESFLEFFLRKAAHFFAFLLIGALVCRLIAYKIKLRMAMIVAAGFVFIYAVVDEYRQSLTPGRTPLVEDIVLDSLGGLTGIVLIAFWILHRRFIQVKRVEAQTAETRMQRNQKKKQA